MCSIQSTVADLLGTAVFPIPLDACCLVRPYLLEREGIPSYATVLFFAVPYLIATDVHAPERNLSLYAIPRDYHLYIRELASQILPTLRKLYPAVPFALFSDHSPLIESVAAARAGMGVLGENHMLITPEYGSFVFIAEIIAGADYETTTGHARSEIPHTPPTCPGCGACRRACPAEKADVQAICRCLSELTQKKGVLTVDEQRILKQHPLIWGCDTCQLVCPLNRAALSGAHDTPLSFFQEHRIRQLTIEELADMTKEQFLGRAFSWRGRAVLERNLTLHAE